MLHATTVEVQGDSLGHWQVQLRHCGRCHENALQSLEGANLERGIPVGMWRERTAQGEGDNSVRATVGTFQGSWG